MSDDRTITSPQNQRIKDAVKLRDRRQRDKQQRIIIDGGRETLRALEAGINIVDAYLCESLLHTDAARRASDHLRQANVTCWNVTADVFEKLAYGDRGDGVIAVAQTKSPSLDAINIAAGSLVAVLEGIEKPGNVGAILRSADAAGVAAVLLADPQTDLYNPNCIRASLGTVFTMPIAVTTSPDARDWLAERNFQAFAARVDGAVDYTQANFRGSSAIILGSEAQGLSDAWQGATMQPIRLPMLGQADSLNVSVTAAVLFYEALRQRAIEN
jgi:TrmH family RNA methyltransferase